MPADNTISQDPSAKHGNGNAPYPCSTQPEPPGPREAKWAFDYGYCRNSLDHQPPEFRQGSTDPRCPRDCPHKAPQSVAARFTTIFMSKGAKKGAEYAKQHREKQKPSQPRNTGTH